MCHFRQYEINKHVYVWVKAILLRFMTKANSIGWCVCKWYWEKKYEYLPVEPKSEKEDEVGEAMLVFPPPPLEELFIIELTIAWWLRWCCCCWLRRCWGWWPVWPLLSKGGGEGELVLLGRLASELLLLLLMLILLTFIVGVVVDSELMPFSDAEVVEEGPKASSWSRLLLLIELLLYPFRRPKWPLGRRSGGDGEWLLLPRPTPFGMSVCPGRKAFPAEDAAAASDSAAATDRRCFSDSAPGPVRPLMASSAVALIVLLSLVRPFSASNCWPLLAADLEINKERSLTPDERLLGCSFLMFARSAVQGLGTRLSSLMVKGAVGAIPLGWCWWLCCRWAKLWWSCWCRWLLLVLLLWLLLLALEKSFIKLSDPLAETSVGGLMSMWWWRWWSVDEVVLLLLFTDRRTWAEVSIITNEVDMIPVEVRLTNWNCWSPAHNNNFTN